MLFRVLQNRREALYEEIAQYLQLQTVLTKFNENKIKSDEPLKTKVDLGNNFLVQAVVWVEDFKSNYQLVEVNESFVFRDDPSKIFVAVGYGFFVQFTFTEALEFLDKRLALLNTRVDKISKDMLYVRAQIRMVLEGLREIQGLS